MFNSDPLSGNLADFSSTFLPVMRDDDEGTGVFSGLRAGRGGQKVRFSFVGTEEVDGRECFVFELRLWR